MIFLKNNKIQVDSLVEYKISNNIINYSYAEKYMKNRVKKIVKGECKELIWLVEHSSIYTGGTSAELKDLLISNKFPVYYTGRGGKYTYHGPGQRVIYVMLDLTKRGKDIRSFIRALEDWIIKTLAVFGVNGIRNKKFIGIWVKENINNISNKIKKENKIAFFGIRLHKWISFYGISINIKPNLDHFNGIVPCGITDYGITSLINLGLIISMNDFDIVLIKKFTEIFGGQLKNII